METIVLPKDTELHDADTLLKFVPVTEGLVGESTKTYVPIYRITLKQDEDGRYIVTCPDLQGVVTDGATEDEAIQNALEAIQAMLESLGRKNEQFMLIQY